MARKIYKRFGLRRDQNFGDLPDARSALNNLLDGLVTVGGDTFVSEDLDPIRNINNIGLTNSQYQLIVGTTTKYTPSSGGTNKNFIPHITFQNRFDKFTVFSGVPRIAGGNGPSASYWQKDQILVNREDSSDDTEKKFEYYQDTNSSASEVLAGITSLGQLPSDNQWERGNFDYTGKIHPQSVLTDGGVTWEGYFVPTKTGPHTFTIWSTGYATFDFNLKGYEEDGNGDQTDASITAVGAGNTYKEWVRVGVTTTIIAVGAANQNEITIPPDFSKTIGIGMSVSGTGLNDTPTVESYQHVMDGTTPTTVTLKPASGQDYAVGASGVAANTPLTFSRPIGKEIQTSSQTQYLLESEKYRFRCRFFFPKDVNTRTLERRFNIDYNVPGQARQDLRYTQLYSLDYPFSENDKGKFNFFFDASVRFGGTKRIGIGGTLTETLDNPFADNNPYVKVKTSDKIQARYTPKTTISGITRRSSVECSGEAGQIVLTTDSTGDIEIGNYVFGLNTDDSTNLVAEGTRVIDIITNATIVIDRPAQLTATQNLRFIDHRGFVKRVKGAATTNNGNEVNFATGYTTDNTDKWSVGTHDKSLKKGMLVLTTPQSGTDVTAYTSISAVVDSNTITLTNGMTNAADTLIYFYESRGLIDKSLAAFCPKTGATRTRCHLLPVTFDSDGDGVAEDYIAAAGQNVIQLVDLTGLNSGLTVQGFGIPDGTQIGSLPGSSITLVDASNNPVNLTKSINGGSTVTIHGLSGDRQLCCPPTDTSPPFEATPRGLITTNANPKLSFTQGNAKFDELKFKVPNTVDGETNTSNDGKVKKFSANSDTVDRKIHIRTGGTQDQLNGLFYLLGTTVT